MDEYRFASDVFAAFSGHILFGFARHASGVKNHIAQNAIARTVMTIRSILALWDLQDYQNSWTLHRSLLDRFFHLCELGRTNSHEAFDDWSFVRQFEAQNRARSDVRNSGIANSPDFTPTPNQRERYNRLTRTKSTWERPKPKDVAKTMGLDFLYSYSYDFASTHVHPMSNDGEEDFFTLTRLDPKPDFPSHIVVLHNSLLVACLLVTESMNQSDLRWSKDVFDFYSNLMSHLEDGNDLYKRGFVEIVGKGQAHQWCEPLPR